MGFLSNWGSAYKRVLRQPSKFFESENRNDGFGFPLKFALGNFLILGAFLAVIFTLIQSASFLLGFSTGLFNSSLVAVGMITILPIFMLFILMIWAGFTHIFVKLLGGKNGYRRTLSAFEYATAITPIIGIISIIPLIGDLSRLLGQLYGIFIQVKGLENFQDMSTGKALGAILYPIVILIGLAVLSAIMWTSGVSGV